MGLLGARHRAVRAWADAARARALAARQLNGTGCDLVLFDSKRQMAEVAARLVERALQRAEHAAPAPGPRVLFPAGSTPLGEDGFFAALGRARAARGARTDRVRLVSGDEYFGVPQSHKGSFATYLRDRVMAPLGMDVGAALQLDGGVGAAGAGAECARYEASLRADNPALGVLGLGTNGHVAFNDPPSAAASVTRRLTLTAGSVAAAQGDFPDMPAAELPTEALSVGLATLTEAVRHCVVLVVGARKAGIVAKVLEGGYVGPDCPATQLRGARNFSFFLTRDAAAGLSEGARAGALACGAGEGAVDACVDALLARKA